jgi:HK97 family phage prohead protease
MESLSCPGTVELRSSNVSGSLGTLTGYASVFNSRSEDLGGWFEQVAPSAFNKTLADGARVVARFQHKDEFILGSTDAGTLKLAIDKRTGLRYDVELPDTSTGRDVKVLAERGDLKYSSFAFRTIEDRWDELEDGTILRTLLSVKLLDVAPVVSPAYLGSSAGMRSLADKLGIGESEVSSAAQRGELRRLLDSGGLLHQRGTRKTAPAGSQRSGPTVAELRRLLDCPPPLPKRRKYEPTESCPVAYHID